MAEKKEDDASAKHAGIKTWNGVPEKQENVTAVSIPRCGERPNTQNPDDRVFIGGQLWKQKCLKCIIRGSDTCLSFCWNFEKFKPERDAPAPVVKTFWICDECGSTDVKYYDPSVDSGHRGRWICNCCKKTMFVEPKKRY